jgi:hypothetical protein
MPSYLAKCHCGAVEFEVESDLSDPVRCNCSLCIRRSAVMVYVEADDFRLIRGQGALTPYEFGGRSGTHYFCGTCGVFPFFHSRWRGQNRYGVNVGCLPGVNPYELSPRLIDGASI